MAPATEIAVFPLNAGVNLDDPKSASGAIWQSTLDTVSQQDGYQRLYWGRQIENPQILTILIGIPFPSIAMRQLLTFSRLGFCRGTQNLPEVCHIRTLREASRQNT